MTPTHRPLPPLDAQRPALVLFGVLALSMLATRYHHFGNALHLADTSWAVFFLAGLTLRPRWMLPALLALAVGIDLAALKLDGSAIGGCLTAAYPGLLLAYLALWGSGRLARRALDREPRQLAGMIATAGWLTLGVLAAFALSNLSFWAWSGQFDALSLGSYADRVIGYLSGYLTVTALYVAIVATTLSLWQALRATAVQQQPH